MTEESSRRRTVCGRLLPGCNARSEICERKGNRWSIYDWNANQRGLLSPDMSALVVGAYFESGLIAENNCIPFREIPD
ncbi:hypothetical protein TNCV_4543661 [Trichonephila clavipes]|nr:hypothetical protein TNCV_4543661 [Trichonephila clavipes]